MNSSQRTAPGIYMVGCGLLKKTADENVATTTDESINFGSELSDVGGLADLIAQPTRLTVSQPAHFARITGSLYVDFNGQTGWYWARIEQNGAVIVDFPKIYRANDIQGTLDNEIYPLSTPLLPCSKDDYFELIVYNGFAANIAVKEDTLFGIELFKRVLI